jgi:alkylation response protein AidB-like acyl-CoA dehydrogenase
MRTSEQELSTMQSTPNETADRILSEVSALAPTIAARGGEAKAPWRIPADILQKLKSAGIFRMGVPQVFGGLELEFSAVAGVLQALARLDGSIGWISTVASVAARLLPAFSRDLRRILSNWS